MEKKIQISEKDHPEKEWFEEASKIRNEKEFMEFSKKIMDSYSHDYGTCVHAVSALALAGAWLGCNNLGITGFQAGCVMWDFIRNWNNKYNECGLKLIDYDLMLYPQYQYRFEKTISKETWEKLQEMALKNVSEKHKFTHPDVLKHWESIVDGIVPFGYKVEGE